MNQQKLWTNIHLSRNWGKYPDTALVEFLKDNFSNCNSLHICELGCGGGGQALMFLNENFQKITLCEFSDEILQKLPSPIKDNCTLLAGDYLKTLDRIKDESVDVFVDIGSLCCNNKKNTKIIMKKISQKLKKGGFLFSKTIAKGFSGLNDNYANEGLLKDMGFIRAVDKKDIQKLYNLDKLKIKSIQKHTTILSSGEKHKHYVITAQKGVIMKKTLKVWDEVFKSRSWGKYPDLNVVRFVARNFYKFEDRKSITILELGSGEGANLWFALKENFSAIALEGSPTAAKKMQKRFLDEGIDTQNLQVFVGDYSDTLDKIEDGSVDCIIDMESLSCNSFKKSKKIIKKAVKKLKKGGLFLSKTFAKGTWGFDEEQEQSYHMVLPKDGPLNDIGLVRYTSKKDIYMLFKNEHLQINDISKEVRKYQNKKAIKEWVIELEKI